MELQFMQKTNWYIVTIPGTKSFEEVGQTETAV